MTRSTSTLRATLIRVTSTNLVVLAVLAFALLTPSGPQETETSIEPPATGGSPTAGLIKNLLSQHDCWTENAPANTIPGHVVVKMPGEWLPSYRGAKVTGLALEQLFNHKDAGLEVYGFCR